VTTPDFPTTEQGLVAAIVATVARCPLDARPHPRELRLARDLKYTRAVMRQLMPNTEYMEWVLLMRLEDEAHRKAADDMKRRRR
jgi:hypothetical protein